VSELERPDVKHPASPVLTTDSVTVPLTIDWYPLQRLEFKVEVPFIYQSNSTTTSAAGVRFRRGKAAAGLTSGSPDFGAGVSMSYDF